MTYTITPDPGYTIAGLVVDSSPVTPAGTYTFTNVTANHTIAASFALASNNTVTPVGTTVCITPAHPCLTIPVNIARTGTEQMRLFHVDFALSPNLKLCGTPGASVLEGTYLYNVNHNTTFFVLDNHDGTYTADGTINGLPCGATASSGNLFNIKVASNGGTGTGTVTVTGVTLRDCTNNDITPATAGPAATVTFDATPVTVAAIASPQTVAELATLTITPSVTIGSCATGPATWSISPALPGGATFSTSSGVITWTPDCAAAEGGTAGTYGPYTLTATAASGETGSTAFSIHVTDTPGTVAVSVGASFSVEELSALAMTPAPGVTLGGCAAGMTPVWSVSPALPSGASFSTSTGVVTWTPACGQAGTFGPYTLTATVVNGSETYSGSGTFSIVVTHKVGTVTVAAIPTPQPVVEQSLLTILPSATLGACAAGPLAWSADSLPGGATFSSSTGQIDWTPACGQVGTYGPYVLTATAATGEAGSSNAFTIVVSHKVGTVTVAAIPTPQTVAEMATLTITPSATTSPCAGTLTWSVAPTLPGGATFSTSSGVIVWTPGCTAAGTYGPYTLTATAATGEAGSSNPFSIVVTNTPVAIGPPTAASASQQLTGNVAGDTTGIVIYFTAPTGAAAFKVYRAPYGHYPEYDDAGGVIPTQPTTWPPAAPWTLTGVTTNGGTDIPPARDFWYYVVYAVNACGDTSVASAMTSGTLDYHLGDVTDGYVHGLGDNLVQTEDISELGAHYGITLTPGDLYNYLDVGPTTTHYVNGRPLTDNKVNFEDLVMFAINYELVSAPAGPTVATPAGGPAVAAVTSDQLVVRSPDQVAMGSTLTVPLEMQGTGAVQALSIRLGWDAAVVQPVSQQAGDLLLQLNGVAMSAAPGTVDAAVLGLGRGVTGKGELATVTFKVIANGDPGIRIEAVDARDTGNNAITVNASREALAAELPKVTTLQMAMPNPFRETVTLAFSLAQRGAVDLNIYSVDGRRVRTLVSGSHEPGYYRFVWDGRDDRGNAMSAGVFYARFVAGPVKMTRTMTYLR